MQQGEVVLDCLVHNVQQIQLLACRGTHWQKYGPLYLISLAIPFIMADLTRHVLQGTPSIQFPLQFLASMMGKICVRSAWDQPYPAHCCNLMQLRALLPPCSIVDWVIMGDTNQK